MEGQELRDGKERVRVNLIAPLVASGMMRKRGRTVDEHDNFLASLTARLSYMTEDRLTALAEVVERYAEGPKKNIWPAEVSIVNWARRLQEPPASESHLVRSFLQSAAGDAAVAGGYLVELFLYLKRYGAPPSSFAMTGIRSDAEDNARRREAIEYDRDEGRASPRDLSWLQGYMDTRRRCLDIIKAKQERSAA